MILQELQELQELEALLNKVNNPIINYLGEPLPEKEVIEYFTRLKLPIHQDLIDFFSWKSGIGSILFTQHFNKALFSNANFLGLSNWISLYLLDKSTNKFYGKKWFPIFVFNTGDLILFNLDVKSKSYGKLFIHAPSITLSSTPMSIYDSIGNIVKTIIACYNANAYTINSDGSVNIDFEKEEEISKKLNPNSDFWK